MHRSVLAACCLILLVAAASFAGCITIEEREGTEAAARGDPVQATAPPAAPHPTATPAPASPIVVNTAPGKIPDSAVRETAGRTVPPFAEMQAYRPIHTETHDLLYSAAGMRIAAREAPYRIIIDILPKYADTSYCYGFWELTDSETGETIASGGYGSMQSTERRQTITVYRPGEYHLNLYGVRLRVTVSIAVPEAMSAEDAPAQRSPLYEEEEQFW